MNINHCLVLTVLAALAWTYTQVWNRVKIRSTITSFDNPKWRFCFNRFMTVQNFILLYYEPSVLVVIDKLNLFKQYVQQLSLYSFGSRKMRNSLSIRLKSPCNNKVIILHVFVNLCFESNSSLLSLY